jgi:hypothetical protein
VEWTFILFHAGRVEKLAKKDLFILSWSTNIKSTEFLPFFLTITPSVGLLFILQSEKMSIIYNQNAQRQPTPPPLPIQLRVVIKNPQFGEVPEPLVYFWAIQPLRRGDTTMEQTLPLTPFNYDDSSFRVVLERLLSGGDDGELRILKRWDENFIRTVVDDSHIITLRSTGDDRERLAIKVAGLYRITVSICLTSRVPQFSDTMIEGRHEFYVSRLRQRN